MTDPQTTPAPAAPRHGGLIYGCMGIGRWDGQPLTAADHERAEAAVTAALEIGITRFDHADIYGHGTAEEAFGHLLERDPGLRGRIGIQSKCGIRLATAEHPQLYDLRPATIRMRVEQSLERLRTDHLDCLLLHRPDPLADPADIGATLTSLYDEGLVGSVGVSNMSAAQIAALQPHTRVPIAVDQLELGLHHRGWLEAGVLVNTAAAADVGFPHGTLELCRAEGIEVQAWSPLAGGRFTGAPREPGDEDVAALIAELAREHGTSPETVLLWWLQQHPARVVPVIGATSPARIRACRDAHHEPSRLTHEQWYLLWETARGAPLP
ncbi:aldo/keto reductase [Nocardioides ultimimeridianus]